MGAQRLIALFFLLSVSMTYAKIKKGKEGRKESTYLLFLRIRIRLPTALLVKAALPLSTQSWFTWWLHFPLQVQNVASRFGSALLKAWSEDPSLSVNCSLPGYKVIEASV